MFLKVIATRRGWGQKKEETVASVTLGGVKCEIHEFDAWEGGDGSGGQQFFRVTSLEIVDPMRDDRFN